MRRSDQYSNEPDDYFFSDDDIDWGQEDSEQETHRVEARRGIDDYFERKELETLDDWFDELD